MVSLFNVIQKNTLKALLLEGGFMVLLGLALGHAGPYGTFEKFDLLFRLAFWIVILCVPWSISKCLFLLAEKFAPSGLSKTYITVMLMPLLAILGSAAVTGINIKVGLYGTETFFEVWPYSILVWLVFSFAIILPMILIATTLAKDQRKTGVTTMMEFFHHKLPDSLAGGVLIALKAEDHYLRVITDRGSALILMKFEDALAALNGYPGIQTHRSWWIASEQLKGLTALSSSESSIYLNDDYEVLVSRRKRKHVNELIEKINQTNLR